MSDPGRLNTRLTLEAATETPDGAGGVTRGYAAGATPWAKVTPLSARDGVQAAAAGITVTHRFVVRAGKVILKAFRMATGGTVSGWCLRLVSPTTVVIDNMEFGQCQLCLVAYSGSTIDVSLGYKIVGNQGFHWYSGGGNISNMAGLPSTITLTGTPAWTGAFCVAANGGFVYAGTLTFSGAATGKRYDATLNGVINTAGAGVNFLPGSIAGTTATGGQYV